jgi:hypothetical protein
MLMEGRDPYALLLQYYQAPGSRFPFMLTQAPFYPPYALVMFFPYAALPWDAARWSWAASNLAFFVLILVLLQRTFLANQPRWTTVAIGAIFACGTPLRNTIGNGQHGLLSLAAFLLAYDAAQQGRTNASAIPLAISMFKYTIAGPLSFTLLRRAAWRAFAAAGGLLVLGTLIAGLMVQRPIGILSEYVRMLAIVRPQGFLDIFSLADKAGIPRGSIAAGVVCGALFALTVWCVVVHGRTRVLLSLSLLGFLTYAVLFHHTYDLIVLVFPLVFLFTPERRKERVVSVLFVATIALTWFIEKPVYLLRHGHPGRMAEIIYEGYYWTTAAVFYTAAVAVGMALVRGQGPLSRDDEGRRQFEC